MNGGAGMKQFPSEISRPILVCIFILMSMTTVARGDERIDLKGTWRFALDRDDAGMDAKWFNQTLSDQIQLPGSLQAQGFGDEPSLETKWTAKIGGKLLDQPKFAAFAKPGDFKTPFWLTPPRH